MSTGSTIIVALCYRFKRNKQNVLSYFIACLSCCGKAQWPPGSTLALRLMGLPGPYLVWLSFWGKFLRAKYFSLLMTLVCLYIYGKDQLVNSSCNNNRILIVLQLLCSLAQSTIICAMLIKIKVQFYSQTMMCFKASNEIFFIHICTSENFSI